MVNGLSQVLTIDGLAFRWLHQTARCEMQTSGSTAWKQGNPMYVWRLFVRELGTARTTETTVTWPNLWRKKPQLPATKSGTAWVSPRHSVVSGDCSIDDTATEYVTSQINCSSPSHKSGMLAMSYRCSSALSRDGTSKRSSHTPEGNGVCIGATACKTI